MVGGEETARQEDDEEHIRPLPILCTPVCLLSRAIRNRSPHSTSPLISSLDLIISRSINALYETCPRVCSMSVRSAHPPVGLGRVVFDSYQNPFDFSTTPDILTHATTLHIIVSSRIRDRSYALTAISSCPNLRTLEVGRAPGGRKEQPHYIFIISAGCGLTHASPHLLPSCSYPTV